MVNDTARIALQQHLQDKHISVTINEKDLQRLPREPFILLCNHLGELEEWVLLDIVTRLSRPAKILSNRRITITDEFQSFHISNNDAQLWSISEPGNGFFKLVKEAIRQIDEQTSLALVVDFRAKRLDGIWHNRQVRRAFYLLKKWQRPIVPVHVIAEKEVALFQQFSPKIIQRHTQNPLEVIVRIGNPITIVEQQRFENKERFRKFVQSKIFALGIGMEVKPFFFNPLKYFPRSEALPQKPIIKPIDPRQITAEIDQLPDENRIAHRAQFDVLIASADQIPMVMQEIGRLRELTFREVGEGTGKSLDLDEYDLYYKQLIIWDREEQKIVGGYRLGEGDTIFRRFGVEGFYIHSLFKIKPGFFPVMQKSIELGRSYVVPDYQKHRLSLFLLWKGILFFLLQHPQYRYLYGPLSISKNYSSVSQSIMVEFVKRYYFREDLAQFLKPRKPFKVKTSNVNIDVLMEGMNDEIRSLDKFIEDIEPEHFRIPVLLKQYVKLNARFISFNIDPNFSDSLDGFIILDLHDVPKETIEALKKEV